MELAWIEDFLTLARLRHFTQAAAARCTTQPAFSRRLQRLEAWLGCKLIDRRAKNFTLTPEGHAFLVRATRLREDMLDARRALAALASHYDKAERIYTTNTLAIGFLPHWLQQAGYVHYALVVASITGCLEALRAGRATLAILPLLGLDSVTTAPFLIEKLGPDCLHLCARADIAAQISLREGLLQGPLLMFAPGTGYGAAVAACLQAQAVRLEAPPVCESASAEALAAHARAGLGAAWIPETLAGNDLVRPKGCPAFDVPYEIALLKTGAGSSS